MHKLYHWKEDMLNIPLLVYIVNCAETKQTQKQYNYKRNKPNKKQTSTQNTQETTKKTVCYRNNCFHIIFIFLLASILLSYLVFNL
jgi:hypothetical protein